MMNKLSVTVSVEEDEHIDKKMNVSIALPVNQEPMSVKNITHLLVGGISMLIKTCGNGDDVGIKDYELIKEVIEHLNLEFSSIESYNDLYMDEKYIINVKDKDDEKV